MRVELDVELRPVSRGSANESISETIPRAELQRRDREERRLKRIALARTIDAGIANGTFADLADVARRCGVSRARVSKLVTVTTMSHLG